MTEYCNSKNKIISQGNQSKDRRREVSGQGGEAVRPKDGRAMVKDSW